ncbi:hypothetical protein HYH02_015321 [Chlamydomonas schloesseri]|uniref:Uncharacterized protein n=1 Tax=Chlamydomonas schloesseri TaxID=2026947 RepID=A0A835SMN5_9CHLO|nr:hypothetical protein HYH02_015321 [Chlamydomonas schloesseri]|eukprot:KAG2423480.1 hypothetical protein HYH02_015321 [Chlamydomonas schloesseri]
MMTTADERRDAENKNTGPRIFPGPWGAEAVLENMVRKAEERIDKATRGQPLPGGSGTAAGVGGSKKPRDPTARKQIQARMVELEKELAAERALRTGLEGEMAGLRESLSRGGGGGGGGDKAAGR